MCIFVGVFFIFLICYKAEDTSLHPDVFMFFLHLVEQQQTHRVWPPQQILCCGNAALTHLFPIKQVSSIMSWEVKGRSGPSSWECAALEAQTTVGQQRGECRKVWRSVSESGFNEFLRGQNERNLVFHSRKSANSVLCRESSWTPLDILAFPEEYLCKCHVSLHLLSCFQMKFSAYTFPISHTVESPGQIFLIARQPFASVYLWHHRGWH